MIRSSRMKFVGVLLLLLPTLQTQESNSSEVVWDDCAPCRLCSRRYHGRMVADCQDVGVEKVPMLVPSKEIQELLAADNQIENLTPYVFLQLGFVNLQIVDLSRNHIAFVEMQSFKSMTNLTMLDLSRNRITYIDKTAFVGLTNVREINLAINNITKLHTNTFRTTGQLHDLYLYRNQIERIEDGLFYNLTALENIDLSDNQISYIGSKAFVNVSNLKYLFLQNNRLKRIELSVFQDLTKLNFLLLKDNPWDCDCRMRDFIAWFKKVGKFLLGRPYPPPQCKQPASLYAVGLDDVDEYSLTCKPKIVTVGYEESVANKSILLICETRGKPTPDVHWMFGGGIVDNTTSLQPNGELKYTSFQFNETGLQLNKVQLNVTVYNITREDMGVYTCSAKNKAGQVDTKVVFRSKVL